MQFWFSAACCSIISAALRKHVASVSTSASAHPSSASSSARSLSQDAGASARHQDNEARTRVPGPAYRQNEFKDAVDRETFLKISEEAIREVVRLDADQYLLEQKAKGAERDDINLFSRSMFVDIGLFIELQA
ncbi:unnamed protein product, partial [Tilletia laevis]